MKPNIELLERISEACRNEGFEEECSELMTHIRDMELRDKYNQQGRLLLKQANLQLLEKIKKLENIVEAAHLVSDYRYSKDSLDAAHNHLEKALEVVEEYYLVSKAELDKVIIEACEHGHTGFNLEKLEEAEKACLSRPCKP